MTDMELFEYLWKQIVDLMTGGDGPDNPKDWAILRDELGVRGIDIDKDLNP